MPIDLDAGIAKTTLRRTILAGRAARPSTDRVRHDEQRFALLQEALGARLPDTVAAYLSMGTEPATLQLIAWLAAQRVRVLLPLLSGPDGPRDRPAWAAYAGPDALRQGGRGIVEPTTEPVPAEQLPEAELLIIPGLAANSAGDRLGRGGGWYDRALLTASQSAPIWLLLNDDEIVVDIPVQPWDRRVDVLVTPSQMLTCEPPL